jgi:hypothetical protein
MFDDYEIEKMDATDVNLAIAMTNIDIELNEKHQDFYIRHHGDTSEELEEEHNRLCNLVEKLCEHRRKL